MIGFIPFYVKIYINRIDLLRLDTRDSSSRKATDNFSNSRLIIADFRNFETLLRSMIRELLPAPTLKLPNLLIHVMEPLEGGLSPVEIRALKDSSEHAGGKKVIIYEGIHEISVDQAVNELKRKK